MASKSSEQHPIMNSNKDDITVEAVRMQAIYTRCPTSFMQSKSWRARRSVSPVSVLHAGAFDFELA